MRLVDRTLAPRSSVTCISLCYATLKQNGIADIPAALTLGMAMWPAWTNETGEEVIERGHVLLSVLGKRFAPHHERGMPHAV